MGGLNLTHLLILVVLVAILIAVVSAVFGGTNNS
jgi:hypothetical protein